MLPYVKGNTQRMPFSVLTSGMFSGRRDVDAGHGRQYAHSDESFGWRVIGSTSPL